MKLYHYIILVFIIIPNQSFAKLENINTKYTLNLNVIGVYIKIGEINSYLLTKDNEYNLNFNLSSENLVDIITSISGNGTVSGIIDKKFLYPKNYQYNFTKKNKTKKTKILFNNLTVTTSETIPNFDKKKLSPINDEMLIKTIDPITAIIYIGNYNLTNKCSIDYRVFDGKRRYNLNYTDIFIKNGYLICRLVQNKIGGFKVDDKNRDLFKPAQQIDTYYKKEDEKYILKKIVTESKFSKISIDVSYF